MAYSQSGYPDIADYGDRRLVSNPTVPGTDVKILGGLLAGDVATILLDVARRYNREVEPLVQSHGCWGFQPSHNDYVSNSNHESGTAMDLNATEHPIGTDPASNFTAAQIAAARKLRDSYGGVVRWGGDYTGRKDGMHWEINDGLYGSPRVAQLAAKIRAGQHAEAPSPVKPPTPRAPAYPLPPGYYYGPLSGPAKCISGKYKTDLPEWREGLKLWQQRMRDRGWRITPDGYFGPQTAAVARAFKAEKHVGDGSGNIGRAVWNAAWTEPVT
jgi:hypothetical protein